MPNINEWIADLYPPKDPQQRINEDFKDAAWAQKNKIFTQAGNQPEVDVVPRARSSISSQLQTGGYLDPTPVTTTTAIPPEAFPQVSAATQAQGESYDPANDPMPHVNGPLFTLAKGMSPTARINQSFADVYYPDQPSLEPYRPTGRERLGSAIAGPENKNADWARQLVGTTGMGPQSFSAIDLTPVGAVMGGQEALNARDYQGSALSILPGVGGRGRFFSQAGKVVAEAGITSATPEVWANYLKNKGVKTEELNWLGLGPNPKVPAPSEPLTKDQLFDHIDKNGTKINETVRTGNLGDYPEARQDFHTMMIGQFNARPRHVNVEEYGAVNFPDWLRQNPPASEGYNRVFSDWLDDYHDEYDIPGLTKYRGSVNTLGGKNYQETLLQLHKPQPPINTDTTGWKIVPAGSQGMKDIVDSEGKKVVTLAGAGRSDQKLIDVAKQLVEADKTMGDRPGSYYGSHFENDPDIIVHALHDDRMIEHPETGEQAPATFAHEIQSDMHQAGRKVGYEGDPIDTSKWNVTHEQGSGNKPWWIVKDENGKVLHSLPDPATKEETINHTKLIMQDQQPPDAPFKKTYPDLMLKRLISHAVENGHDFVAWPVGKTLENKYGTPQSWFYDKELVNKANDLGKKYGAQVKDSHMFASTDQDFEARAAKMVRLGNPSLDDESEQFFDKVQRQKDKLNRDIHVLPITEKLKQAAIKGFPLFTAGALAIGHPADDAHEAASNLGTQVAAGSGDQYARAFLGARLMRLKRELDAMPNQGTDAARQIRVQQQQLLDRLKILSEE